MLDNLFWNLPNVSAISAYRNLWETIATQGLPRTRTTTKLPFRAGQTGNNHDDCCPFAVVGAPDSNTYIIWLAKKICSKASL